MLKGLIALALFAMPCLLSAQTLLHRYSFATDASDSVGGPAWNGTVVAPSGGTVATIANGLTLPGGGGGGFSGYVSLPNAILTATTNLTVEVWATQNTGNTWATIWCFDNSTAQNFQFCPDPGRNNGNMIVDINPNNNEADLSSPTQFPNGTEEYVAMTYNNSSLVENLYTNGAFNSTLTLPNNSYCPGTFGGVGGTTQNWLGRDTYNDTQFQGTVYELRIWNGVVSQRYLAASAIVGPGTVVNNLTPTSATLTAGPSVIITGTEQASVTVQLAATGSANLPATGDATNWVSSNPSVLAVNASGVITGVGAGSATVSATVAGVIATSGSITVTGPQALAHRYSFVSDASDSVGGPTWNGAVIAPTGAGSAVTINNGLTLPGGGGPGFSGYVALPPGILTNTTSITVETWVTQNTANTWAEVWDFANTPSGSQSFGLIPRPGNNGGQTEIAFDPQNDEIDLQSSISFPNNQETYVAVTYNNFSLVGNLYTNGGLIASHVYPNTSYAPGSYGGSSGTQSNMLGQDIFPDGQFQGTIYEFRIWNGALSPTYVAVANAAGPSVIVTNVTPLLLSLTVNSTSMIGTQTQQASVTGNFNQAANVTVTGAATNWVSSNPNVLTVNSSGLITAISVGSATVSATVNGVVATSPSITVTSSAPTAQGPANITAVPGDTVTFSVSALGGNLTYQWSDGATQILGATNATLTLTNVSVASAGTYSVLVTNSLGRTNPSATLTIVSQLLQHRYSFVSDATDSVGGPAFKGTLVPPTTGAAATINNGLSLPGAGGGFGVSGYVSLPAGILTNTSSVTIECWLTQNSQNTWAEPWDFGSDGAHNFGLITYPANNANNMEVAFTPHGNEIDLQSTLSFPNGSEQYVAVSFNSSTLVGNLYTNGGLLATHTYPDASYTPGTISLPTGTSENMLGNDVYGDEQFSGTIYEFRIWDGAVSPLYLAISAAAGPSVVVTNLTPVSVSVSVANSSMVQGQSQPATAIGNFVDASGINVTAAVTNWNSSNTGVLTVDASGNVTAVGTGSATISGTVNGVVGTSASITVAASAPVITVEPAASETLLVGGTLNATLANIGTPPFTYFWFTNGGTTPISISSSPTLTIANLQLANAATYTCLVSNQIGTAPSSPLSLAVVAPTPYQQVLLQLNPLALWPLNESSGSVAYDIIGGNNGTYTGSFTLGQAGPANAFFSGATAVQVVGAGYVDVPEGPFNITGAITVIAWAQPLAQNGFEDLIGHGDQSWRLSYVSTSGNFGGNDGGPSADASDPTAITDNNWHMIAYTYTGNTNQANNGVLYVDGVPVATNNVFATPAGNNLDVWIGGAPDYGTGTGSRMFAGNIADAAVFTRALTAAQVQGVFTGTFVANQLPAPSITHVGMSAGNIIITGTNNAGPGGTYHLLTSTNVTLPLSNWTVLTSGSFDGTGTVHSTNAINPATSRSFYILEEP